MRFAWLLAIGYWLLAISYRLSAIGYWSLAKPIMRFARLTVILVLLLFCLL